jgi:oligopeptide transport system substrate-binding protein
VNPPPDGTQAITGNQKAALQLLSQAQAQCHGVPPDATPTPGLATPPGPVDPPYCPYIDAKHYSPLKEIDIYTANTNATRVEILQAAASQWSTALGLNVQPKTVSKFSVLLAGVESGTYGAFAIGWIADYPDPQDFLSLQFMTNSEYNFSHVPPNAGLDSLFTKADTDQNPTTRMQEYNQAEQEVVNLVPWIPYAQEKVTWRLRPWVYGFALNAVGSFPDLAWPLVKIYQH